MFCLKCVHIVIDRRTLRKKCELARSSDMTLKSNFLFWCRWSSIKVSYCRVAASLRFFWSKYMIHVNKLTEHRYQNREMLTAEFSFRIHSCPISVKFCNTPLYKIYFYCLFSMFENIYNVSFTCISIDSLCLFNRIAVPHQL